MTRHEPFKLRREFLAVLGFAPFLLCLVILSLLARARFEQINTWTWVELGAALSLIALFVAQAWQAFQRALLGRPSTFRHEVELGSLAVALGFVATVVLGSSFYPVIYLVLAVWVSFVRRSAGLSLLAVCLVFDAVVSFSKNPPEFWRHAAFLFLFATLYHFVLSARLRLARRAESDAIAKRIREVEERARAFRLVGTNVVDENPGAHEEEKWLVASVKEVEGAVSHTLEMLETAIGVHTCAVYMLSPDERLLHMYDCRTESEHIQTQPISAVEGIFGGVVQRHVPIRLFSEKGIRDIKHYSQESQSVCALLAVPLTESSGAVRGLLVADRSLPSPFTDVDEKLLKLAASQVLRAIEVERIMGYIRKTRDEKDKFFRAIEEMNRATGPEEVFSAVIEAARQIATIELCAVTLVADRSGKREHRVARLWQMGKTVHGVSDGYVFPDNTGLVSNVVRYGTTLPSRELSSMERQVVFDQETIIRGLGSLKIFPLSAGARILGTLVCGSRQQATIDEDAWRMLEVIAIQAGQTVLRAQLYEQMETMATTDGLTGMLNHRTFQARADDALAFARRYNRSCALLLTDIDHFKSVNDTYGHPTGDLVLKGVAAILRDTARDTDIVARYGGEEFAIVMPETDAKGAQVIAERIRESVEKFVFQTEAGPLRVTLSLGIATCPEHSIEKQELIDLADQCLYFAKRNGRNQSVTVSQMLHARKLKAVDG